VSLLRQKQSWLAHEGYSMSFSSEWMPCPRRIDQRKCPQSSGMTFQAPSTTLGAVNSPHQKIGFDLIWLRCSLIAAVQQRVWL
jgi:hypothetical protein